MSIEKTKPFFEIELNSLREQWLSGRHNIDALTFNFTINELVRKYNLLSDDVEQLQKDYKAIDEYNDTLIAESLLQSENHVRQMQWATREPRFKTIVGTAE